MEPIILQPVSAELVDQTEAATAHIAAILSPHLPSSAVQALGSSAHIGGLSKGDIDVWVCCPAGLFAAVRTHLDNVGQRAQAQNWSDGFASFRLVFQPASAPDTQREIGVQVSREGDDLSARLERQRRLLEDRAVRARYDIAKRHGAKLGNIGYWRVKDLFWWSHNHAGPTWQTPTRAVLKVLTGPQWETLKATEMTKGAPIDTRDGYVHLSMPTQVHETVEKYFAGQSGLWLLTLDASALGDLLRWEPSRGGALFPHLYGPLRLADITLARPLRSETAW